jgi:hypothetical protein
METTMIKAQMMKSECSFSLAGLVLAIVVLGFTAVSRPPSLPFRETVLVRIAEATSPASNRYFCENGRNGQYSEVHQGWVCATELLAPVVRTEIARVVYSAKLLRLCGNHEPVRATVIEPFPRRAQRLSTKPA